MFNFNCYQNMFAFGNPHTLLGGLQIDTVAMENHIEASQKIKNGESF